MTILSCLVLSYAVLHDDFYVATGLLVYAGLTDLVRCNFRVLHPDVAHLANLVAFSGR